MGRVSFTTNGGKKIKFKTKSKKKAGRKSVRAASRAPKRRKMKMARRKRTVRRRAASRRRKSTSTLTPKDAVLYGLGYGVVREPLNQGIKALAGNLPVIGTVGDEVALGALHYFGAKGNWFGMKKLFITGLAVESHNLGRNLAGGALSGIFSGGSSTENADNL